MKRPNLQIVNTGELYCCEGIGNIFNKVKKESIPHLEKQTPVQVQGAYTIPNRHDQKRSSSHHIIEKSIKKSQNKDIESFKR